MKACRKMLVLSNYNVFCVLYRKYKRLYRDGIRDDQIPNHGIFQSVRTLRFEVKHGIFVDFDPGVVPRGKLKIPN